MPPRQVRGGAQPQARLGWVVAILVFLVFFGPTLKTGKDPPSPINDRPSHPPSPADDTIGAKHIHVIPTVTITRTASAATALPSLMNAYTNVVKESPVMMQDSQRKSHPRPGISSSTGSSSGEDEADMPLWEGINVLSPIYRLAARLTDALVPFLTGGRHDAHSDMYAPVMQLLRENVTQVRDAEFELDRLQTEWAAHWFLVGVGDVGAEVASKLRALAKEAARVDEEHATKRQNLLTGRVKQEQPLLWRLASVLMNIGSPRRVVKSSADKARREKLYAKRYIARHLIKFLEFRGVEKDRRYDSLKGSILLDDADYRQCPEGLTDIDGCRLRRAVVERFHSAVDRGISAARLIALVARAILATWESTMKELGLGPPSCAARDDEWPYERKEARVLTWRYWQRLGRWLTVTFQYGQQRSQWRNWKDARDTTDDMVRTEAAAAQLLAAADTLLEDLNSVEKERARILAELRDLVKMDFLVCKRLSKDGEEREDRPANGPRYRTVWDSASDFVECVDYVFPDPADIASDIMLVVRSMKLAFVDWKET